MRGAALAAALLLAGCIDFREVTLPEPPPPDPEAPAEFHATILSDEGSGDPAAAGPRLRVAGNLSPGRDARGAPHAFADDTLRVAGAALAPYRTESDGVRWYEGVVPLPTLAAQGLLLDVAPPASAGGRPPRVQLPIPVRLGPDTVEMRDGADLRLPVLAAWPASPRDGSVGQSWQLEVGGGQASIRIEGTGRLPDPLVLPAGLVPRGAGGEFPVSLAVHGFVDPQGGRDGGYAVEIAYQAFLRWTVRRTASAPAGRAPIRSP